MKIASYYQKLLETSLNAAKSMEPITFAGMFDCGVDYLFSLSIPLFEAELDECSVIFLDLSGLSKKEEIESEIRFAVSEKIPEIPKDAGFDDITKAIRTAAKNKTVLLVLYLGQDGQTDKSLYQFLNRTRNYLGWRFSYCLFATCRILRQHQGDPLIEKVLKRNLIPVLPLSNEDANVVLQNYEERYKKSLTSVTRQIIIDLSGGNPGLIKALYLQAITNQLWKAPDMLGEQLYFRLKGVVEDMPDDIMVTRYGYSSLDPFLQKFRHVYKTHGPKPMQPKSIDPYLLHFSKSQRKVIEYLKEHTGALVTKDDLAKILWGEDWADRYSDWAIDQLISTLREKLAAAKHDGRIVTKKGEGIIFLSKGA